MLEVFWAPGGEEITPTMKLKRAPIAAKYADVIESLYAWAHSALFLVTSRCSSHVEFGPDSVTAGAHTSGLRLTFRVAFRFQGITG